MEPTQRVTFKLAGLMQPDPAKRLGAKGVRKAAYLSSFPWKKLEARELAVCERSVEVRDLLILRGLLQDELQAEMNSRAAAGEPPPEKAQVSRGE